MSGARFRTVRVFISSTFRDMQSERDHLVRFVFPRLREALLAHRVQLVDVDLRWGVTSDQDALDVCREVIDDCRPHFLCILGGRYGWTPPGKRQSITADEVHYGVLGRALQDRGVAFFYFRDPPATAAMREATPGEYREPPGSAGEAALDELKAAIGRAGYRPVLYAGRWDAAAGRLIGLEAFGERVFADLFESIVAGEAPDPAPDLADDTDVALETFVEQRLTGFVLGARAGLQGQLLDHLRGRGEGGYLCLAGEPGAGKSTLLASVGGALDGEPDQLILTHFVGVGPGSADVGDTLRRLSRKLGEEAADVKAADLAAHFAAALATASRDRRIAVIVDGLDGFSATDDFPSLGWLPQTLPPNVRFLVSATAMRTLIELPRYAAPLRQVSLPRLQAGDQAAIVSQFLRRYSKALSGDQQSALLAKADAGIPLYLLAALEELRTLGGYEEITARIRELPPSTAELFAWLFRRLEADDGFRDAAGRKVGPALTRAVAALISASRRGLSERELGDLVAAELAAASPEAAAVLRGNLSALLLLLRPYLRRRGELIEFNHDQIRTAAASLYLETDPQRVEAHQRIGSYFLALLRVPDGAAPAHARDELLFHLRSAAMWDEIVSSLSEPATFDQLPPRTYGVDYQAGVIGGRDFGGIGPEALAAAGDRRAGLGRALAGIFAARARDRIAATRSFARPWPLTAERLRGADAAAFGTFRDTFYEFMHLASLAFGYALIGCDGSAAAARAFLGEWGDVARFFRAIAAGGAAQTGLSRRLEDAVSTRGFTDLMDLSGLLVTELGADVSFRGLGDDASDEAAALAADPGQAEAAARNAGQWITSALPVLRRIGACFDAMAWRQDEPAPDAAAFEASLRSLMAELPPAVWPCDAAAIKAACDPWLGRKVHHGSPVPDDYQFYVVFPTDAPDGAAAPSALRLGLFVTEYVREGYGRLTAGYLVQTQRVFPGS